MRIKTFIACMLLSAAAGFAQSPQTQTAPLISTNSKYVNGIAPGYAPTAATGLHVNIGPGTVNCAGSMVQYSGSGGGGLALTGSTTNYVYLNTAASCAVAVKTAIFTSADIPIATVVTGVSSITSISDQRTPFFVPGSAFGVPVPYQGILGSTVLSNLNQSPVIDSSSILKSGANLAAEQTELWGHYLFVAATCGSGTSCSPAAGLFIVDVSDPVNPVVTAIPPAGSGGTNATSISVTPDGHYAYVSYYDTAKFDVIDVSNKSNPSVVGTLQLTALAPVGSTYANGYVYVGTLNENLTTMAGVVSIVNVSTPASPSLAGSYTSPLAPSTVGSLFNPVLVGNTLFVEDLGNPVILRAIDVSSPSSPTLAGSLNLTGDRFNGGMSISGNYAYISAENSGPTVFSLLVANISNPTAMTLTNTFSASALLLRTAITNGSFFGCASSTTACYGWDLNVPAAPVSLGTFSIGVDTKAQSSNAVGRFAFITTYTPGVSSFAVAHLHVVDLNNFLPLRLGKVTTSNSTLEDGSGNIAAGNSVSAGNALAGSGCYTLTGQASGSLSAFTLVTVSSISGVIPQIATAGLSGVPVAGVVQTAAASGVTAQVCMSGYSNLIMDGTAVAGNMGTASTSVAGEGHDTGQALTSNVPMSQMAYRILKGCSGAGCTAIVRIEGPDHPGRLVGNDSIQNPSISINSQTCTLGGICNVSNVISQSAVPVFVPSSGTIATNGIVTLTTALPFTPPYTWFYFPAGAVSGGLAGLYYATCTSTTSCQVYTNYVNAATTAFRPTVQTSPVAAVGSNSPYTQTTGSYLALINTTIGAGAMGANGVIIKTVTFSTINNTNTKAINVVMGGTLGTSTTVAQSIFGYRSQIQISNEGDASHQSMTRITNPWTSDLNGSLFQGTLNTANAQALIVYCQLSTTATDYCGVLQNVDQLWFSQ